MGIYPVQGYTTNYGPYMANLQANGYPAGNTSAVQFWPTSAIRSIGDSLSFQRKAPSLVHQFRTPEGFPASVYMIHNSPDPEACPKVVIVDSNTDIKSVRTFFHAGSIYERSVYQSPLYPSGGYHSGIAHELEHLLHSKEWADAVSAKGIAFNASTESEMVQYEMTGNNINDMLSFHTRVFVKDIDNVSFIPEAAKAKIEYPESEHKREEKAVINEGHQRMSDPKMKIRNVLYKLIHDRPVMTQTLGTEADVQAVTPQELRDFRKRFYNSYMTTVIAGRVNHQEVLATLDKAYKQITPQRRNDLDMGEKLALAPGEIRYTTLADPQLTYSVVDMSFPAPRKDDLKDRVAMEFIGNLLDGGPSSLLEKRLIHDKRLATAIGVEYGPMKQTGIFGVTVETTPGLEREALREAVATIAELSRVPLTSEKTNELRQQLTHKFRHELNNVEFTTHMIGQEIMTKSLPYYTNYIDLVNSITPQDIMRVAQQYLSPTRYAVVYGVPSKPLPQQVSAVAPGGPRA